MTNTKKRKETKLEKDVARLLKVLDISNDWKKQAKEEIKIEVMKEVMAVIESDSEISKLSNKIRELEGRKMYV